MTSALEASERLKSYLDEGERVLWHGVPLPGIRNVRFRVLTTLLGLGLLIWGFAVSGSVFDHTAREGLSFNTPVFLLFGVFLIGAGWCYSFFQWRAAASAHVTTRYVLTNRCAYIMVGTGFGSMESYLIQPGTAIELDLCEGYSDVWFHVRYKHASAATKTTARVGFEGIADGEQAFMHMRSIQTGQA